MAKNCFHVENTTTDCRIFASLERELQAAFQFEDDNGRQVNLIWVVRILLGRILRERTALARAIRQYTKFQRCEIMHGMVKLNDLEDRAESPLNGGLETSSLAPRQHDGTELEVRAGRGMGTPSNFLFG